jgi:hypothetical protein
MRVLPAVQRRNLAVAAALLGAATLLGACTSPSVPPTPDPSPRPTLPIDIASLRTVPAVTDLAGRFTYGAADGHIWTIDIASGVRTQVTHGGGGADFDPHWSSDGFMLVFRTERFRPPDPMSTGYNGIFVVNADGSAEHPVNPRGGGLFPEWSREDLIVFSSPRPDGSEGLFSVGPDGSGLRDLQIYGEHVTWSPDGTETLVDRNDSYGQRQGQDWNIWRGTKTFTSLTRLTTTAGDDHFGGWSPDAHTSPSAQPGPTKATCGSCIGTEPIRRLWLSDQELNPPKAGSPTGAYSSPTTPPNLPGTCSARTALTSAQCPNSPDSKDRLTTGQADRHVDSLAVVNGILRPEGSGIRTREAETGPTRCTGCSQQFDCVSPRQAA